MPSLHNEHSSTSSREQGAPKRKGHRKHRKINAKCSGSKNCKAEKQGKQTSGKEQNKMGQPRKEDNIVAVAEMSTVVEGHARAGEGGSGWGSNRATRKARES